MTTQGWEARLNAAYTESDVVAVACAYLAALTPDDIAQLPEPCHPRPLENPEDVTSYALDLVRHQCGKDEQREIIHDLALFFAYASKRLSHILTALNAMRRAKGQQCST